MLVADRIIVQVNYTRGVYSLYTCLYLYMSFGLSQFFILKSDIKYTRKDSKVGLERRETLYILGVSFHRFGEEIRIVQLQILL